MSTQSGQGNGAVPGDGFPQAAVVACVESGVLEPMTVRMMESLRRYGGRASNWELYAVRCRVGPPLAAATHREFDRLGVHFVDARPENKYAWHHFLNKPHALLAAEAVSRASTIVWLDSDLLVLGEPGELVLRDGEDFAACAPDDGVVGTTGPGSPHEAFWQRAAASAGLELDSLPWLETSDQHRIRFYWNGGVLAYRRESGFAAEYLRMCVKALDDRVAGTHSQTHFVEQVAVGLAVLRLQLRWRALSASHNFAVLRGKPERYDSEEIRDVRLLHFHDSMKPENWPLLLRSLEHRHPGVFAWLAPHGPALDPASRPVWLIRHMLRVYRGVHRRAYYRSCGFSK